MKKAIAISCAVFSICMIMSSCGEKEKDSSNTPVTTTVVTEITLTTTTHPVSTETEIIKKETETTKLSDDTFLRDVSEVVGTIITDAGNFVSDVIDDMS